MAITHAYVSSKSDPGDSSLIGKTKWNDDHVAPPWVVTLAGGRTTVTPPAGVTEIDTAYRTLIDLTNLAGVHLRTNVVDAASTGTTLLFQTSPDQSAWTTRCEVDVDATGVAVGFLGAISLGEVYCRLATSGGDNSNQLILGAVHLVEGGEADSGGFDFGSIAGLVADWDPDALGLADNDAIAQLDDQSGNAHHLVQATGANKPTYKTAVVNGKDIAQFDGSSDSLSVALDLSGTDDITIFFVGSFTSNGADMTIAELSTNYNSGTDRFGLFRTTGDAMFIGMKGNVGYATFETTGTITTTPKVVSATLDKSASTNEATAWINGSSSGTRAFNSNNTSGNFANSTIYVGARAGTSNYAAMKLARLLIYNTALGSTDRGAVEAALTTLYGIS